MNVQLVIIDPQEDFCNEKTGSLYVPGAAADITRLAQFVTKHEKRLDDIHITMDSHHKFQIFHPLFWKDASGNHPTPFTMVSVDDVKSHRWTTTNPGFYVRALQYVEALQASGRYALVIWPYHCLIGSPGHAIAPELFAAVGAWEENRVAMVNYKTKGSNMYTEHYSAVKAEVPDPKDPTTQIDQDWIKTLLEADIILFAGEALSHCVKSTVEDTVSAFGNDDYIRKMVFLTDASSSVGGFEQQGSDFLRDMAARGMRLSTTVDFF